MTGRVREAATDLLSACAFGGDWLIAVMPLKLTHWRRGSVQVAMCAVVAAATTATLFLGTMFTEPYTVVALEGYSHVKTDGNLLPHEETKNEGVHSLINMTAMKIQSEARRMLIDRVCNQFRIPLPTKIWHYKADPRHGLVYCPIPKAGWSSWKRFLFYINGAINDTQTEIGITNDHAAGLQDIFLHQIIGERMQIQLKNKWFFFTFVRNPWTRLVSAYINKAIDWNYTRLLHVPCSWQTMEPYSVPLTFTQFLTCIADGAASLQTMDIHWMPMWRLCDFCRVHYDYVGHVETMNDDARYILHMRGLNGSFPHIFASKAYHSADVERDWYKDVPASVVLRLRELYMMDFLLHGYSDFPPGWTGARQ